MDSFALDIAKFAKKAEINAIDASRLIVLYMFNAIVQRTPVKTGRAKGSWTVGVYTLGGSYREDTDQTKKGSMSASSRWEVAEGVESWKAEGSIYLTSNLEYMPDLEYGGSQKQAPEGMVRITIADFQTSISKAIRQVK